MRMREGAAVLGAVVAGMWALQGGAPAARADRSDMFKVAPAAATIVEEASVGLVPIEDGGGRSVDHRPLAVRPQSLQQGAVPVVEEDFEGDFPPEGWTTYDLRVAQGQQENYTWGNQDVLLAAPAPGRPGGGLKAPWSIGGGRLGANLSPGSNYDQPVATDLVYGPFDATDFDGGVQVNLLLYLDGPVGFLPNGTNEVVLSFRVCASTPVPTELRCYSLNYRSGDGTDLRKRWLSLQDPLKFPFAAGLPAARIYFRVEDATPTGTHTGSLIDNVTIEGLSSSVPTATLEPGVTPSATRLRETPAPSETPASEATPPPATPDGSSRAYLPIAVNNVDKDIMAPSQPTALPGSVVVGFGTNVLNDGTLVGQGTRFGRIFQLCSAQRWTGLPVDTLMSVQWYEDVAGRWQKIILSDGNERLNPTTKTTAASGFLSECVNAADGSALEPGRFRVAVFLRGEAVAWADEVAEVTGNSGPGPTPSAVPTLPANCQNPVVNGDFELGGEGWSGRALNGHELLRTPGFQSRFAIDLGGYDNAEDILVNSGKIETLPLEDIASVQIKLALGMLGNETRGNGDNADKFFLGVVGDAPTDQAAQWLSEDSPVGGQLLPLGQWVPLSVDLKDLWAKRDGFNSAQIFFGATTNGSNPMAFGLDNVAVEYCRTTGEVVRQDVRWTPARMSAVHLAAVLRNARPFGADDVRRTGPSFRAIETFGIVENRGTTAGR